MKNTKSLLIAAAAIALFASAGQSRAQAVGDDGIAASPKLRQMLNEKKTACCMPRAQVTTATTAPAPAVTASPRVQQMLRDGAPAPAHAPHVATETAGFKATG